MAPPKRRGTKPNKPARQENTTRQQIIRKGKAAIDRHQRKMETMDAIEAGRARARRQRKKGK